MNGLLGIPLHARGSARARYGHAMRLWGDGRISLAQLEAYRVASVDDCRPPSEVLSDRHLPVPPDLAPEREALLAGLLDEADRYLSALPGPGIAEVRAGLARVGGVTPLPGSPASAPLAQSVVDLHLAQALAALAGDGHLSLASAIAAAAPHLTWTSYDSYPRDRIGAAFADGHAFCSLVGEGAPFPAQEFDFGLFLIAPHVLYRDHAHPAPELYAPLTGPHGWRFGPDRPLVVWPAHVPVWNPPQRPHLTKVGPLPLLCLFAWTADVNEPAMVLPAADWAKLEALRLG
jgi:hypothetical protein